MRWQVAEGGGAHEALPMLLRVPVFSLPPDMGGYSMLGFGDIILPGALPGMGHSVLGVDVLNRQVSPCCCACLSSACPRGLGGTLCWALVTSSCQVRCLRLCRT